MNADFDQAQGLNATSEDLHETFSALAPAVPCARRTIARYAATVGFEGGAVDSIRLAVSEAVTNVVRHAYPDQPGEVELVAGIAPGELWVRVADRGCGFQRPSGNPGLGYGFAVIAEVTEAFELTRRPGGGTELHLHFELPRT